MLEPAYNDKMSHYSTYLKSIAQEAPHIRFHCYASYDKTHELIAPNAEVEPLFVGNTGFAPVPSLKEGGFYLDSGIAYFLSKVAASDQLFIPTLDLEMASALTRAFELRPRSPQPFVHASIHAVDNELLSPLGEAVRTYGNLAAACNSGRGIAFYVPFSGLIPLLKTAYGIEAVEALHLFPGSQHRIISTRRITAENERFKVGFVGNARAEKGLHLVPYFAKYLKEKFPSHLARIDWYLQTFNVDDRIKGIIDRLELEIHQTGSKIILDIGEKSDPEYLNFLESLDIFAFPYARSTFKGRGSGIAVDATMAGKPFVYTSELILGDHAPDASLAAATVGQFAEHIARIMDHYEHYSLAACIARTKLIRIAQESKLIQRLSHSLPLSENSVETASQM